MSRFHPREAIFGVIALGLLVAYLSLGSRAAPVLLPAGTLTPTPSRPVTPVPAPQVFGSIAFVLRGDVFVVKDGRYASLTDRGRDLAPNISQDGRTVIFARTETIDGRREVDGNVTPAILRYTDVVKKDLSGGSETVLLTGLRARATNGFHSVAWQDAPAWSPDGRRFAVTSDVDGAGAELEIYDAQTGRRQIALSQQSNLADPAWSPDGKTVAVTSYTVGAPYILLIAADGSSAVPLKVNAEGEYYRASFSPDGAWLVYTLRRPTGGNDIHAVEVKTGRDVALTSDGHSWNGVFDPTGTWIAFMRETGGVIDLYAMDLGSTLLANGTPRAPIKLTRGEGVDGSSRPTWSK
jgi:Tol biopolymer transport system component